MTAESTLAVTHKVLSGGAVGVRNGGAVGSGRAELWGPEGRSCGVRKGGAVAFDSQACKRPEISPNKTLGIAERWHWLHLETVIYGNPGACYFSGLGRAGRVAGFLGSSSK
jgi:hypothetical protein